MSDLTHYWHDESVHLEPCECMVPDVSLQQIADAPEIALEQVGTSDLGHPMLELGAHTLPLEAGVYKLVPVETVDGWVER